MNNSKFSSLFLTFAYLLISPAAISQNNVRLPKPTGPYDVGNRVYHWIDSTRVDTISNVAYFFDKTSKVDTLRSSELSPFRQMVVSIWYPAKIENLSKKTPYFPYLTKQKIRPDFYNSAANFYEGVITNSYENAPVLRDRAFPVIIFSTGRASGIDYYSSLAEEFASSGYIFVGVNSAHATNLGLSNAYFPALRRWKPNISIYDPSFSKADSFFQESNKIISQDILFIIKKIEQLNAEDSDFRASFQEDKIGLMGHSMGGMAASLACKLTNKCKALLRVEAAPAKKIRTDGLSIPSGLIISEFSISFDNNSYRDVYTGIAKRHLCDFHLFTLHKSGHNSIMDLPFLTPTQFNYEIEPLDGISITRKISVAFFDSTLLKKGDRLKEIGNKFDLLTYEHFYAKN